MIGELTNHLWQSTVFAIAAALLAWALRRNRAETRHSLWVAASIKFLIPFSLLIALGAAVAPVRPAPIAAPGDSPTDLSIAVDQIAQPFDHVFHGRPEPFETASPVAAPIWPSIAIALWAAGFLLVVGLRVRGWRQILASIRASHASPIQLPGAPLEIRSADDIFEPGVIGWKRPVLLLPAGIERHLSAAQLAAVLEHELCHVRRRDNLTAAIHMAVEAVFWFHPMVWWIGARLVDERERACDEYVLDVVAEPTDYAEGILAVCKRYVESPVACVSGVTGSDLKRRITNIVNGRIGSRLTMARRGVLVAAAVAAIVTPFLAGVATAPLRASAFAREQAAADRQKFDVVSIKPCPSIASRPPAPAQSGGGRSGGAPWDAQTSPGYIYWSCTTLAQLVDQAYADADHPLLNTPSVRRAPSDLSTYPKRVRGGPSWVNAELFTIEARAPLNVTAGALSGNPNRTLATLTAPMSQALRNMLDDRFQVKVRREKEQQDMYALTVANGGLNPKTITKPKSGDCLTPAQYFAMDPSERPADPALCGRANITMDRGQIFTSFTMRQLAAFLSTSSIERYVMDATGLDDEPFNFVLLLERGTGAPTDTLFARALEGLGLKLVAKKGPAEYLQIDSAERPRPDEPAFSPLDPAVQDKFDVASIKLNTSGSGQFDIHAEPGGRLVATNITLQQLLVNAYDIQDFQLAGGPDWLTKDHFDVEAKAAGPDSSANLFKRRTRGEPSRGERLLRALLADRFKLEVRLETRDLPLYELAFARPDRTPGPQLKRSARNCEEPRDPETRADENPREAPPCGVMSAPGILMSGGVSLADIASWLSPITGRAVVDRTSTTDRFEFVLKWTPDRFSKGLSKKAGSTHWAAIDDDGPSLATALREQLGLKLESRTGPVKVLVIDRVSRLIPN